MSRGPRLERRCQSIRRATPRQRGRFRFRKFGQHPVLESGTRGRAERLQQTVRMSRFAEPSLHVGVEPGQGTLDDVAAVLGAGEQVTFVLVDYELRFNA
jgi:hypothetical protein